MKNYQFKSLPKTVEALIEVNGVQTQVPMKKVKRWGFTQTGIILVGQLDEAEVRPRQKFYCEFSLLELVLMCNPDRRDYHITQNRLWTPKPVEWWLVLVALVAQGTESVELDQSALIIQGTE